MPYINKLLRTYWEPELDPLLDKINSGIGSGELTYLLYKLAIKYTKVKGQNFHFLNETHGCMVAAAGEFKRRHLDVHEEGAIERNGDVT